MIVPDGQVFSKVGEPVLPKAESLADPNLDQRTDFYENSVVLRVPLRVDAAANAGRQNLSIQVRYQACSPRLCLPVRTDKIEIPLDIRGAMPDPSAMEPR